MSHERNTWLWTTAFMCVSCTDWGVGLWTRHWGSFVKRRNWLKRVRIVWPQKSFDPERLWGVSFKLMLVPVPRPPPLILHCTVYPWVSLGETTKTAFIALGDPLGFLCVEVGPPLWHTDSFTWCETLHAALNLGRFYHNKKKRRPLQFCLSFTCKHPCSYLTCI